MKRHTAHNSNDDINDDIKENDYDHNNSDDNDNNVHDDKDSNEQIQFYKSHIKICFNENFSENLIYRIFR